MLCCLGLSVIYKGGTRIWDRLLMYVFLFRVYGGRVETNKWKRSVQWV